MSNRTGLRKKARNRYQQDKRTFKFMTARYERFKQEGAPTYALKVPPGTEYEGKWNGEPCECRVVLVEVADDPSFPRYWARPFVGTIRKAIEVHYRNEVFYLDTEDGMGYLKTTEWEGSPMYPHRGLNPAKILTNEED